MNRLLSIYVTFGKGDGEELREEFILMDGDTAESLYDNFFAHKDDVSLEDIESLLKGDIDTVYFNCFGGDWDDPTGGFATITKESDIVKNLADELVKQCKAAEKRWGKENMLDMVLAEIMNEMSA